MMSLVGKAFVIVFPITLVVYILRGMGILTFIPGGSILVLLLMSFYTGIFWLIGKTRDL